MARLDRLVKETTRQDFIRLEYDPLSSSFAIRDLRITNGDEKESDPVFSEHITDAIEALQVPVDVLEGIARRLKKIPGYPLSVEDSIPPGSQMPINGPWLADANEPKDDEADVATPDPWTPREKKRDYEASLAPGEGDPEKTVYAGGRFYTPAEFAAKEAKDRNGGKK
jgi:hypothetical protein